jgi:predicted TIM-barrel fold metal-dependent hydrolase
MALRITTVAWFSLLAGVWASSSRAETAVDPALAAAIATIPAIDNHAHPTRVVGEGEVDDEFDAMPLDGLDPFPSAVNMRPDNPQFIEAWKQLYGYPYRDLSAEHVKDGLAAKGRVIREKGDGYPSWVLDQIGTETLFANRIALGRGLAPPRFRWVSFADPFLVPLNNEGAKRLNRDYAALYPLEEKLLKRYLAEAKQSALPKTFEQYLQTIVTPTLERHRREGAVAVKFEAAYLRRLDFEDASEADAKRVYERFVGGGEPPAADYKTLQDFLFRFMAREAGRLGLAVHIHSADGGGGYYRQTGSNPLLLESAFNDPTLRKTNFVIVHGGYPFTAQTGSLLSKPNVYADFSYQAVSLFPRALSQVIRTWLELFPEKVLFGTDASPTSPEISWEETAWLGAMKGRQALGLALTGMMEDGEIPRERAIEIARMVLRDNARKLYGLGGS